MCQSSFTVKSCNHNIAILSHVALQTSSYTRNIYGMVRLSNNMATCQSGRALGVAYHWLSCRRYMISFSRLWQKHKYNIHYWPLSFTVSHQKELRQAFWDHVQQSFPPARFRLPNIYTQPLECLNFLASTSRFKMTQQSEAVYATDEVANVPNYMLYACLTVNIVWPTIYHRSRAGKKNA